MADLATPARPAYASFYAIEPSTLKWNRFYKVYVTDSGIAGAWIAGQFHVEHIARAQLQRFYPLLRGWVNKQLEQRRAREARYDRLSPSSHEFLSQDQRNFRISRIEVRHLCLVRKYSLQIGGRNAGILRVCLADRTTRTLIISGDRPAEDVSAMLRPVFGAFEETGSHKPVPQELTPEQRARGYRWDAFFVLGMMATMPALMLLFVPSTRLKNPAMAMAVFPFAFGIGAAIVFLRRARREKRRSQE